MEIQIFNSPKFGEIRIAGTSENPMFCLSDVCRVLEIKNARDWKSKLNQEGVVSIYTPTHGGNQQLSYINEMNLYKVIMRSDKPQAEPFQDWVCGEVLPSIRKSGGYMVAKEDDSPEEIMARALTIAQATLAKREERLKQLEQQTERQQITIDAQATELQAAAPKVTYYDETLQSVNTLTTTQIAKELGLDAPKLNQRLKQAGVIFRQSGMWMLRQPYSSWKLTATRTQTFTRSDGSTGTSMYTVWNERGRRFIHALNDCEYNARKAMKTICGKGGEL